MRDCGGGSGVKLTSGAGGRALGPGQEVPGEAHFVVSAARALDGHVEPVVDAQVLLLQEHLEETTGEDKRQNEMAGGDTSMTQ